MSYIPYTFPFTGGLDRSVIPSRADKATFYTLHNFRQSNSIRGMIEQTPRFRLSTVPQGTYWNGSASVTEPTASGMRWYGSVPSVSNTLTVTEYCAFTNATGATQLLGIVQSTVPSGVDNTKGCLLIMVNTGTATITRGNTYDVVIDGANTFKWRVNGGAYTTGVVIDLASGNLIDTNSVRLYWLASTGFTVTDTWSWLRTDSFGLSTLPAQPRVVLLQQQWYAINNLGQVFVIELPVSGQPYIRSVGYRPVYGNNLGVFEKHFLIYGTSSTGTTAAGSYVLSSDNSSYDSFIATDVNEADFYPLELIASGPTDAFYVLSGVSIQGRLYVVTTSGIYYTDYYGLPVPFSFKRLLSAKFTITNGNTCFNSTRGTYIMRDDAIFFFNGTLQKICNLTSLGLSTPVLGLFNFSTDEACFSFGATGTLLIYQENYGTFYTRAVSFSAAGATMLVAGTDGLLYSGTTSRRLYQDALFSGVAPQFDAASGVSFSIPTITTQLLGGDTTKMKESGPVYIAPTIGTADGSFYSIAGFIKLVLSWYVSADAQISGSPATDANANWTSALTDDQISYPRVPYRYLAFQLTLTGTDGTKPPGAFSLQALETEVYVINTVKR